MYDRMIMLGESREARIANYLGWKVINEYSGFDNADKRIGGKGKII